MKRPFFIILIIVFLFSVNSCSDNGQTTEPITTDISITSTQNSISWVDFSDLTLQLDNVLNCNYGIALERETQKERSFNADTMQVTVTIDFKIGFQSVYNDSIPNNNSVTIQLIKDVEIPNPQGVQLKADGPGNTYDLITSILAPHHNPIETSDCNHTAFGNHINKIFDSELNTNVFRFFVHTSTDNDRCLNFDRQRNEVKTYDQSPNNLLGTQNETVIYKWEFKFAEGFQSSPNFTHIHQLKSVGGLLESMPMYTLTTRKGSADKLELRYTETDSQITLAQTDINPLINTWLEVTEIIKYGTSGTYDIEIKKVSDNSMLLSYSNPSIINWRSGADFVRPKWGIYRSLINEQDRRDEEVLFDDFSVLETE